MNIIYNYISNIFNMYIHMGQWVWLKHHQNHHASLKPSKLHRKRLGMDSTTRPPSNTWWNKGETGCFCLHHMGTHQWDWIWKIAELRKCIFSFGFLLLTPNSKNHKEEITGMAFKNGCGIVWERPWCLLFHKVPTCFPRIGSKWEANIRLPANQISPKITSSINTTWLQWTWHLCK